MTDTHVHLYSTDFKDDLEEMLQRALDAGVEKFYMPAIDSSTHARMMAVEKAYEGVCLSMIGLHPCSVKENVETELDIIGELLQVRSFAGIGETGLDFYWDKTFTAQQYQSLEKHIGWALEYGLPLILHTRNATQETIDVVKQHTGKGLRGIFHCFGGSTEEAEQIIGAGFYLGIGGVVTYKNAGLDFVLKETGIGKVVLETDAPYLSPVPVRGKRNESSYLVHIVKKIAEITGISEAEIATVTDKNAASIFNK